LWRTRRSDFYSRLSRFLSFAPTIRFYASGWPLRDTPLRFNEGVYTLLSLGHPWLSLSFCLIIRFDECVGISVFLTLHLPKWACTSLRLGIPGDSLFSASLSVSTNVLVSLCFLLFVSRSGSASVIASVSLAFFLTLPHFPFRQCAGFSLHPISYFEVVTCNPKLRFA
jgi:hypothetical protein